MAWLLHTCPLYQSLAFSFYQEANLLNLRMWTGWLSFVTLFSSLLSDHSQLFTLFEFWSLLEWCHFVSFPSPLQFLSMCVCTYQKMTNFHTTKPSGFPFLLCTVSSLRRLDVASLCTLLVSSFLIKAFLQFTVLDFIISCILLLFILNFYNLPTLCI